MKIQDLDRSQIYDLRGITHEQAEELLQWLIDNDNGWDYGFLPNFHKYNSLIYFERSHITTWTFSYEEKPTTSISTLFELSYEEQLIEAVKRVEELKRKINEPKVGDWMFMKYSGFRRVKKLGHGRSLQGSGWQKVTDPFTLETLNNYNK